MYMRVVIHKYIPQLTTRKSKFLTKHGSGLIYEVKTFFLNVNCCNGGASYMLENMKRLEKNCRILKLSWAYQDNGCYRDTKYKVLMYG